MLSRRHLRIKVLQILYGYFSAGFDTIGAGEKELLLSINRFYDLFLYQLSFLSELYETALKQSEDAKLKHLPTEEELNPNARFINNRILRAISENPEFSELYKKKNISWIGENEIVRKAFLNLKLSNGYKKYMSDEGCGFIKEKEIVVYLIKKILVDFPQLMHFYEEKSIFWVGDMDMVSLILLKKIRACEENSLDKIFSVSDLFINDEDREFVVNLFRQTIMHSEEYEKLISEKTVKWEVERIAMMDIMLMKMAISEILVFDNIPVNVTLNEYIELSKMYSSPKSSIFINGILDNLIKSLRKKNLFNKTGTGRL